MIHSLENARAIIDRTDREMARLFQERMLAVKEIARYKAENGLPVFDPEREAQVIEKNATLIEDKELSAYYVSYLQSVMDISKKYQSTILPKKLVSLSRKNCIFCFFVYDLIDYNRIGLKIHGFYQSFRVLIDSGYQYLQSFVHMHPHLSL